jgi:hypothetical protein
MQLLARSLVRGGAALLLSLVAACGGGGDDAGGTEPPPPSARKISDFLLGVRSTPASGNISGRLITGSAPAAGTGPTVTTTRVGAVIPGGSTQVTFRSATAFTRALVALANVADYYEVTFPAPVTEATVAITVAQRPPESAFQFRYAAGTAAAIGGYQNEAVTLTTVGTGSIQVSVSWNTPTDVDLYLVEPGGREIYYGAPTSPAGGRLDLDSNAGCTLDNRNNENITYPTGTPPSGQYIVRVNLWSGCNVPQQTTTYVVTVNVRGNVQTFTGTVTGAGNGGAAGAGTEITRFTF